MRQLLKVSILNTKMKTLRLIPIFPTIRKSMLMMKTVVLLSLTITMERTKTVLEMPGMIHGDQIGDSIPALVIIHGEDGTVAGIFPLATAGEQAGVAVYGDMTPGLILFTDTGDFTIHFMIHGLHGTVLTTAGAVAGATAGTDGTDTTMLIMRDLIRDFSTEDITVVTKEMSIAGKWFVVPDIPVEVLAAGLHQEVRV